MRDFVLKKIFDDNFDALKRQNIFKRCHWNTRQDRIFLSTYNEDISKIANNIEDSSKPERQETFGLFHRVSSTLNTSFVNWRAAKKTKH